MKRKEETKNKTESAAGDTSSSANKLVIELNKQKDRVEEAGVSSPIPQVDGPIDKEQLMKYEFVSNYAEEDVEYTLEEIFPEASLDLQTLKQCRPRSADYLYTVTVKLSPGQRSFWPEMQADQADVFKNLKILS